MERVGWRNVQLGSAVTNIWQVEYRNSSLGIDEARPCYLSTSYMQEGLALLSEPKLKLLFASVVYLNCVNYSEGFGGQWMLGCLKTNKKRMYTVLISSEGMHCFFGKCNKWNC